MDGKIYKQIVATMDEIGAIGKNKKNRQQGFMYRGIDDVMNELQPAMVKNGIFVVPEVVKAEYTERTTKAGGIMEIAKLRVQFTFYADDGSNVQAVTIGEAMDNADKATNKAMAIALKYACFQVFMIPTEEMAKNDPDGHTPEPLEFPVNYQSSKTAEPVKQTRPQMKTAPGERQENIFVCEICGQRVAPDFAEKSRAANNGHVFCSGTCRNRAIQNANQN